MAMYQHLLVAVALDDSGERILRRAAQLAEDFEARLSVIHVVEYIPLETGEALMAAPPDLSAQMQALARSQLATLCERNQLHPVHQLVVSGGVAAEVRRGAEDVEADLIVVGHHPRHGLAALFSHVEEDIVQRAHCDVLALHLP